MKKEIIIVGAGDVGKFVAHQIDNFGVYTVRGFLDDDKVKHGTNICGYKVLGGIDYVSNLHENLNLVVAIANPIVKSKVLKVLSAYQNIVYPTLIHPKSWIDKSVIIGSGCIIYPGVAINYETHLDDFVIVNMNATIGHNCCLRRFSTISPGVNLGGFTNVGLMSFIGIGANTLQSIFIGEQCTIGGGTMVINNIPHKSTVVGNPGRVINIKK